MWDFQDIKFSIFYYFFFPDFNQDGRIDNISFMIKRIKVHSEDALRDPNYRFPGKYGVEKYLELFSGKNFPEYKMQKNIY